MEITKELTIEMTEKGKEIFTELMLNPNKKNSEGWDKLLKEFADKAKSEIISVYFT